MRTFGLAVLAALVTALPAGAQSADDLAGPWTFVQETPRGSMTHTVTFTLGDDGWAGTMSSERRTVDLDDVTFVDGRLAFSFEAGPPPGRGGRGPGGGGDGGTRTVTFEGTLDGTAINGAMDTPRGSRPMVLTRKEG